MKRIGLCGWLLVMSAALAVGCGKTAGVDGNAGAGGLGGAAGMGGGGAGGQGGVSTAPMITSAPVVTATVGVPYTYDVDASGAGPIVFSLGSAPSGMAVDGDSGVVAWTPSAAGTEAVEVAATNGFGSDTQAFTVAVDALTDPVFTSFPPTDATDGVTYTYDPTVVANGIVTWSAPGAPAGFTIDEATGAVSWTPGPGDVGTVMITIRATDDAAGMTDQSFTVTVSASTGPATITSAPPTNVFEGETLQYQATASGAPTLTWTVGTPSMGTAAPGVVIDTMPADGPAVDISWDTSGVAPGAYTVAIEVDNEVGEPSVQEFVVTVDPRPPVPVIDLATTPPPATVFVDTTYGYDVNLAPASDSANVSWSIVATTPPALAITIDAQSGLVGFTPSSDDGEMTYEYRVRATNVVGDMAEEVIQVGAVFPPATPMLTVTPGSSFALDTGEGFAGASASATGNPPPALSVSGMLPSFLEFDTLTGQLSAATGKPAPDVTDLGTHMFDIVATNSEGMDAQTITIVVTAAPPSVDAITPAAGRRQSDVPIVVKGTGFVAAATPEISLELGGYSEALATTFVDTETLTATVPIDLGRPSGAFDVVVDQGNATTLAKRFTVTEADGTTLAGAITFPITLAAANSPYRVIGSVRVENGATVTMEPGTVVMFDENTNGRFDVGVNSAGGLIADGGDPGLGDQIVFTRFQAAGGAAPTGHYRGLRFGANVVQANTTLQNVVVEFGGRRDAATNQAAVELLAGSVPTMLRSIVRQSVNHGLDMDRGAGSASAIWFDENTLTSNGRAPISVHVDDLTTLGATLTLVGNNVDHIEARGGNVERPEHRWRKRDVPVHVTSTTTVRGGAVLTVDAGVELRFNTFSALAVSTGSEAGALIAVGTSAEPIRMVPHSGVAGEWSGISISENPQAGTVLRHVNIEDFGGLSGQGVSGGLRISNDDAGLFPVIVENCVIRSTVADTRGLFMSGNAKLASFQNNIVDTTAWSVNAAALGMHTALGSSNVYEEAIQVRSDTIDETDVAWATPRGSGGGVQPVQSTGTITANGVDWALAPGFVLQMSLNSSVQTHTFGTLTAVGTELEPIRFEAAPGVSYWSRIYLRTDGPSGPSVLDHVEITGAGGDPALGENSNRTGILVTSQTVDGVSETSTPSITNTTITDSNGYGVVFNDANTVSAFSDNTISGARFSAVRMHGNFVGDLGTNNTLTGNNVAGLPTHDGIWVSSDRIIDSATWTDQGVPYIVSNGNLNVRQQTPTDLVPTLALEPGVEIRFGSARRFVVGNGGDGSVSIAGAVGNPVTLTSTEAGVFWRGLDLYEGSDGSSLDQLVVSNGGSSNNEGNLNFRSGSDMVSVGVVEMLNAEDYAAVIFSGAGNPVLSGPATDRTYAGNGQESMPGAGDPLFDCVRDNNNGGLCTAL